MQQSNTRVVYKQPRILRQSQHPPRNTYSQYNQGPYNTGGYRTSVPMNNNPLEPEKRIELQNRYNPPGQNLIQYVHQPSNAQYPYSNNNYNQEGYNAGQYRHSIPTEQESFQPQDTEKRTKLQQDRHCSPTYYPTKVIPRQSNNQDTYLSNNYSRAYNTGGYRPSVPVEYESSQSQGLEKRTELLPQDRYNKYGQMQYLLKRNYEDQQDKKCCCCKCKNEKSQGCKKCCQVYDCCCEYLDCFCRYVGPFLRNGNT